VNRFVIVHTGDPDAWDIAEDVGDGRSFEVLCRVVAPGDGDPDAVIRRARFIQNALTAYRAAGGAP